MRLPSIVSRTALTLVLAAGAAGMAEVSAIPASAATSSGCVGGGYSAVLPDGSTVKGNTTVKLDNAKLADAATVKVIGHFNEFDFAPRTGNIYNYVYTGAANPDSMNPGNRVTAMASKTIELSSKLTKQVELRFDGDGLVILSTGAGGKVKIQAKDCATGGLFQQEIETANGAPVKVTHTLGAGVFYYKNPFTGKINFGNGAGFVGKDSPQVATKLSQSDTVTTWSVASGGRMGQVLGEDAVELSTGATNCVSDCQAQNQIRGSLPVTDPAFNN